MAKRLPQLGYNLHLAPSDFFFFGYIKERLTEINYINMEGVTKPIIAILNEIAKDILFALVESWVTRVKWVIKHRGHLSNK
jgi:hypothetical protein